MLLVLALLVRSPDSVEDWELLARADCVVAGIVAVDVAEGTDHGGRFRVTLRSDERIVGSCRDEISVEVITTTSGASEWLMGLQNRKVIGFVGEYADPGELQLAGPPQIAMIPYTTASHARLSSVEAENARAYSEARSWGSRFCLADHAAGEVNDLMSQIGVRDVAEVMSGVKRLGVEAVRPLICGLENLQQPMLRADDLGGLMGGGVQSGAHYTPQQKVDVADYLLTHQTGRSFGALVNGGTDRQRRRAIRGWWIFAGRGFAGQVSGHPGETQ